MVLMATGRAPHTEGLNLSALGIQMDGEAIRVNEYLETSVKDVYAIGDVLGKNMLAHVASYEGEVAVENALGRARRADYHAVPNCIFCHPEIAGVGITEKEASEGGIDYKVSKFPFAACGRAVTIGETTGLVKLNVQPFWQYIVVGIIVILAVLIDQARDLVMQRVEAG